MNGSLFERPRRVHMIGIGGAGMNGIASALAAGGHRITGSDLSDNRAVVRLREQSIPVGHGHSIEHVPADTNLVVISAAILEDNPELVEARALGLPVVKYAEALGALMAGRRGIAVSGAHGKTTTTGLLSWVLDCAGADPTFVMGGEVGSLGGSSRVGAGEFLVAEACEYDRSFHHLRPEIAVVTNIDEDHLDCYRNMAEITEAFRTFGELLPATGYLVTLNEHESIFRQSGMKAELETVGIGGNADWVALDVKFSRGRTRFRVFKDDAEVGRFSLSLIGHHNVLNTMMVLAVAMRLGIDAETVSRAVASFPGVRRRMEVRFDHGGVTVVDDYAHHPAEIRASLNSLRAIWPGKRIWCVFQPHQASRTRFLLREFAAALSGADRVVVPPIYFARDSEEERRSISSLDLVKKVMNLGTEACHMKNFEEIERYLFARLRPWDLVITMGAGDIHKVAEAVSGRLIGYGSWTIPGREERLAAAGADSWN